MALRSELALSALSDFTVALTTINWSTFAGLKRHFGVFAALGAYRGEHLASRPIAEAIILITICLPCFTACETALRLIGIAFGLEELLFLNAESEGSSAIGALERFVLEAHWMTSSLLNSWLVCWPSNT